MGLALFLLWSFFLYFITRNLLLFPGVEQAVDSQFVASWVVTSKMAEEVRNSFGGIRSVSIAMNGTRLRGVGFPVCAVLAVSFLVRPSDRPLAHLGAIIAERETVMVRRNCTYLIPLRM